MSEPMRLHRYIAQSGICSRRKAEEFIAEGRVLVNGDLVTEMGVKVTDEDRVEVDGEEIKPLTRRVWLMNKPKGVITSMSDPYGRKTVADLMAADLRGAKPVGRLDQDTEGLLLLTTDGDLAMRLTHAKYGVEKEYEAVVVGSPGQESIERLLKGVFVEERRVRAEAVKVKSRSDRRRESVLMMILHEGRKRQVRLMCEAIGHPVKSLKRIRIGHLTLKGMQQGECRLLPQKDVERLRALVDLS